jgi:hypothetical protein
VTTSGTYQWSPSIADLFLESFARIGVQPPNVTRAHVAHARRSTNLLSVAWTNRGINLWAIDLQTINLLPGIATYPVPPETMTVLDVYYSQVNGAGAGLNADRIMTPMSRDDYAEIPNKLQPGAPTRYWFEKLADSNGNITIWQPPLAEQASPNFVVNYYRFRRMQDAVPTMGQTPDIHYRFLDVFAAELAVRLAEKFKPELIAQPGNRLERAAAQAWQEASETDREDTPISIMPMLGGYGRR